MSRLASFVIPILILNLNAYGNTHSDVKLPPDMFQPDKTLSDRMSDDWSLSIDAVSESSDVSLIGRRPFGTATYLVASGDYSFMTNGSAIQVLNISDPSDISSVGASVSILSKPAITTRSDGWCC